MLSLSKHAGEILHKIALFCKNRKITTTFVVNTKRVKLFFIWTSLDKSPIYIRYTK